MTYLNRFVIALVLLCGLNACGFSLSELVSQATEASATEEAAQVEEAEKVEEAQVSVEPTGFAPAIESDAKCRVDPIDRMISLTHKPNVAELEADEWELGQSSETAFTLIEYGDFQ